MGDTTKFTGKITRQLFPKDGIPAKSGDFAIIVIKPIEILEGSLEVHPLYKTITAKGIVADIDYSTEFTFVIEEVEPNNYGKQFNIMSMYIELDFEDKGNQRIFLETILTANQIESLFATFENPMEVTNSYK